MRVGDNQEVQGTGRVIAILGTRAVITMAAAAGLLMLGTREGRSAAHRDES